MAHEFRFPDVGEGIKEGKIVKWLVKVGDTVNADDSIAEVETDKAVVELPAPESGTILKRNGKEGDTIHVGDSLVVIGKPGEDTNNIENPRQAGENEHVSTGVVGEVPKEEQPEVQIKQIERRPDSDETAVMATPAVRALAKDLGLDLSKIEATGLGGRITEQDVKEAPGQKQNTTSKVSKTEDTGSTPSPSSAPQQASKVKIKAKNDFFGYIEHVDYKGMRKAIGEHMEKAWTAPTVTHMEKIDVTELYKLREAEKKQIEKTMGIKLTYLAFIVKATAKALEKHPMLNAQLDKENEDIIIKKYYNIGIAVDTGNGLVVLVIKVVQDKSVIQIAKEIIELAEKGRHKKLDAMEMRGGTFTITNIGSIGGVYATPVLNSPETAILGVMRMLDEALVINNKVEIRKTMNFVLTFDHRITDGAEAARFMNTLKQNLEDRELLLLDLK